MPNTHHKMSSKKATNVTVNVGLLCAAKELGINLSATLEQALDELIKQKRAQAWLAENRVAIGEYNLRIEESGTFGEQIRDS